MTAPESAPARPGRFLGYGLTLATLASFLALTLLARMFYPFLPYFLVALLTVLTVAAAAPLSPLSRLEAQMAGWLLAAAFVAMTVVSAITLPEEVHPGDGPRCPGSGPPLCADLKEWWDEHLRARGQHERGIAILGWSSFIAAGALSVRHSDVRRAGVPRPVKFAGLPVPDYLSRRLSITVLALNGLLLWAYWLAIGGLTLFE